MTTEEVSEKHYEGKVSVRTLHNWRNIGSGPPYMKIGGKVLYKLSDLEEWDRKRTVTSTSQYSKAS